MTLSPLRPRAPVDRWASALCVGYAGRLPLPSQVRLDAQLSAALLRRAVEPFRLRRDDWEGGAAALLELAELACPHPVRA